jgi:protein-S-isoprenylcysteine O-methyltransferase Ste14
MRKVFFIGYWAFGYFSFIISFLYLIGFIGNRYTFSTIDSGLQLPFREALVIDLVLLGAFFAQHSIMARRWFKQFWRRLLPEQIERSSYVLASSLALAFLFYRWEPMPEMIWNLEHPLARGGLHILFWTGWAAVIVTSFLTGHWRLVGLRQALRRAGVKEESPRLVTPGPYRRLRHPMMIGLLLGFWATPEMSRGHLLFATANLLYVAVAVRWEERDLVKELGAPYEEYRRRTPRWGFF